MCFENRSLISVRTTSRLGSCRACSRSTPREFPRARITEQRAGTRSKARVGDGACGLGPHSARDLSFQRGAAAGARSEHRTGAEGAGAFRRCYRSCRPGQRPDPAQRARYCRFGHRKALLLDGGSAWAWSRSGWIDAYRGDPESAIERFKIALDLAPQDPLAFNSLVGIGCAHFAAGNYAEAARWQQRALIEHPSASWVHRTLCPAYLLAGAKSEARRSLDALRAQYPKLTLSKIQQGMPPLPEAYCDLVVDALHGVGLPA
jgi:hypothetical protein